MRCHAAPYVQSGWRGFRDPGLLGFNQPLCHLSYPTKSSRPWGSNPPLPAYKAGAPPGDASSACPIPTVWSEGVEPSASSLATRRPDHLNYGHRETRPGVEPGWRGLQPRTSTDRSTRHSWQPGDRTQRNPGNSRTPTPSGPAANRTDSAALNPHSPPWEGGELSNSPMPP